MLHEPHNLVIGQHQGQAFSLDGTARLRHLYVIGATGTGKSWLLRNLIAQDLEAGAGVVVIDPLGDLATAVISLINLERSPHFIYINPADLERPIVSQRHRAGRFLAKRGARA